MPFKWLPATVLGMMREVMNDLVTSCLKLAGTSSKAAWPGPIPRGHGGYHKASHAVAQAQS